MKQKSLQILSLLAIMLMVGVSSVWAGTVTLDFKTLKATSGTTDDISWVTGRTGSATATACNETNGLVLYGVSDGGGYFNTTSATSSPIVSVELVTTAKKNTPKYTAYGSTDGSTWTEIKSKISAGTENLDLSEKSYTYFKIQNTTGSTAQLAVTSIVITYGATPKITASDVEIETDATSGEIAYTLTNSVEGKDLEATTTATWISNLTVDKANNKVTFVAEANTGKARTAEVTLSYEGATSKTVKVTQKEYIAVYNSLAELVADGEPTEDGVKVSVVLSNEIITSLASSYIIIKSDEQNVKIYRSSRPSEWVVGGKVSANPLVCTWKKYGTDWELCPSSWNDLSYTEPDVEKFAIEIASDIVGGTVTSDPADEAAAGKTVTLTASAAGGYIFEAWSVNDKDDNPITVTDNSFVMPAKGVTVSATFSEVDYVFYESFNTNNGTGGNDDNWSGSIASSDIKSDNTGWTFENEGGANQCAKFGSGSKKGSAITPEIDATGVLVLTFKAAAWNGTSETTTLNISSTVGTISQSSVTLKKGEWTEYKVYITDVTKKTQITFEAANASNNRFFLDEVKVYANKDKVTITSAGWATACLPFNAKITDGTATAYYVTNADETAITKAPITVINAGEGFLLKGSGDVTFTKTADDADDATGNMMKGSLTGKTFSEPNYNYYILANDTEQNGIGFYFYGADNTTGTSATCAAGKAVLAVPTSAGAKEFLPLDEATGIDKVEVNGQQSTVNGIFNLAGQKVGADYKGVIIVNGKKYLNK